MPKNLRVVVVDDHPLLRSGVVRTLRREGDIEVLGEGVNADDAVRLAREHLPHLILLDINMPGDGISAAETIARTCPETKVVMLTVSEDETNITAAFAAGASGYILKGICGTQLVDMLRAVCDGEVRIAPTSSGRFSATGASYDAPTTEEVRRLATLSARQRHILELVAEGQTNREIGDALGLTQSNLRREIGSILKRLRVPTRVKAAFIAQRAIPGKNSTPNNGC